MKLLNYRTGFANNSSSTHSVFITENPVELEDYINDNYFGWDDFVITSKENLMKYVSGQIYDNISDKIPEDMRKYFVQSLTGVELDPDYSKMIDHQSRWFFPRDKNSDGLFPSVEYIKDLLEYLQDKNVSILGGSDSENSDRKFNEVLGKAKILPNKLNKACFNHNSFCLKDGDVWKLFNKETGDKIRFSFKDDIIYEKSSVPELVDLIITNKCRNECSYCYRDCKANGNYAPINKVVDYITNLKRLDVFEIVLGGGNILQYPEFDELCDYVSYYKSKECKEDFVFSTTINPFAFYIGSDIPKIDKIMKSFSSVAFSISRYNDLLSFITNFARYLEYNCYQETNYADISIQIVPELLKVEELKKIINFLYSSVDYRVFNLTLLGVKQTGRCGQHYNECIQRIRQDTSWFNRITEIYQYRRSRLGIDTKFIENFPQIKERIPDWTYTEKEGKFSCCIDAVENTVSPSSFSEHKDSLDYVSYKKMDISIEKFFQQY